MSFPARTWHPPRKVLLATDLSARCDRALDRAAQLCAGWNARLAVLHAMDPAADFIERAFRDDEPAWRHASGRRLLVESQLRRDLPAAMHDVDVLIEEGEPAAAIDRSARAQGAELIVTGVARDETLGRALLGTTVSRLARRTPVPMLVVRSRARPYGQVLVATDFSASSRHALQAALAFFPAAGIILLHAFEAPYLHTGENLGASFAKMAREAAEGFLAGSGLAPEQQRRVTIRIEEGSPATVVRRQMAEEDIRLAVLGSHGQSAVFDVLIGSTARRVLEMAPADVLLVREPRAVDVR